MCSTYVRIAMAIFLSSFPYTFDSEPSDLYAVHGNFEGSDGMELRDVRVVAWSTVPTIRDGKSVDLAVNESTLNVDGRFELRFSSARIVVVGCVDSRGRIVSDLRQISATPIERAGGRSTEPRSIVLKQKHLREVEVSLEFDESTPAHVDGVIRVSYDPLATNSLDKTRSVRADDNGMPSLIPSYVFSCPEPTSIVVLLDCRVAYSITFESPHSVRTGRPFLWRDEVVGLKARRAKSVVIAITDGDDPVKNTEFRIESTNGDIRRAKSDSDGVIRLECVERRAAIRSLRLSVDDAENFSISPILKREFDEELVAERGP